MIQSRLFSASLRKTNVAIATAYIINEPILSRPEVLYITVRNQASTSLNGIVLIGDSFMPLTFIDSRNLNLFSWYRSILFSQ